MLILSITGREQTFKLDKSFFGILESAHKVFSNEIELLMLFLESFKCSLTFLDMKDKFIPQNSELTISFTDIFGDGEDRAENVHLIYFRL